MSECKNCEYAELLRAELERVPEIAVNARKALTRCVAYDNEPMCAKLDGLALAARQVLAAKPETLLQMRNTEGPGTQAGSGGQSPALPPNESVALLHKMIQAAMFGWPDAATCMEAHRLLDEIATGARADETPHAMCKTEDKK